nr:MAG TPA: hypothetical protein [Caudoviricetes sp.]
MVCLGLMYYLPNQDPRQLYLILDSQKSYVHLQYIH